MRLRSGAATDVGQVRSLNEDGVLASGSLCAVADGMGGHRGGEVASAMALAALGRHFSGGSADDLIAAVAAANEEVHDHASRHAEVSGMGTTLCAVALVDRAGRDRLCIVNIGDSRAYLVRDGELHQVSEDHSLVETLVREGRLSEGQAAAHPQRNVVTRALGIDPVVIVDAWEVTPIAGERVLLCSDGLFNEVAADQIARIIDEHADPQDAADELVAAANRSGARDNVSAVVVDPLELDADAAPLVDAARIVRLTEPVSDLGLGDVDAETEGAKTEGAETEPGVVEPAIDQPEGGAAPVDDDGVRVTQVLVDPPLAAPSPSERPSGPAPVLRSATASSSGGAGAPAHDTRWVTWRVVAFAGAMAAVMVVAFGAVALAARSAYFVKLDQGEVVVFQGRPGGLLWFEPTVESRTGIRAGQLPSEARLAELSQASGVNQPSAASAKAYVDQLSQDIVNATSTTTTTTSTTTTTTTTTIQPVGP